ncbi:MAG: NADH:flavin oxidoreductase/NADH oxidase [Rudaea sp.]
MSNPSLFSPLRLGGLTLRNRIAVSPMCEYSAVDGVPDDWHLVHLGSRAVGGAGLVMAEASAVSAEGRITLGDAGIWNEAQASAWQRIAAFIRGQGAAAGIQLAHAGRKASTAVPWHGGKPLATGAGAWTPLAPSAVAFDQYAVPKALDDAGIQKVIADFAASARRAREAGFELIEIHAAHGYLLHEFLSPLSNLRTDKYGGALDNRVRLLRTVVAAVRDEWPAPKPLSVRVSATDWAPAGGWDIDECVELARWLKHDGVDLIDVSSGGNVPHVKIPLAPGYQVPFARRIRHEADIATGAVGLITTSRQAQEILERGDADLVFFAREMLRDPYFPRRAAQELGVEIKPPDQYLRAW